MLASDQSQSRLRPPLLRNLVGDLSRLIDHSSLHGMARIPFNGAFKDIRKRIWCGSYGPDNLEWDPKDQTNGLKQEIVVR